MTLKELEYEFSLLPKGYKTKDVDKLNKRLIKENKDVSFLKEIVLNRQEFYRTYFQVEMGKLNNYKDQMKFIEDNYLLLNDWWHVDELTQFVNILDLKYAYNKAKKYVNSKHPFLRRWGYVLFMPRLVKEKEAFDLIISLLKDDDEYYVVMAEAWLISYLAIYHPERTLEYLNKTNLKYNIVGRAIQKTCDSFRVSKEYKEKIKKIRSRYK